MSLTCAASHLAVVFSPAHRTKTLGPHLLRTLCVLRAALDSVPKRQWYASCQRVYARLSYEIKRLGHDIGEVSGDEAGMGAVWVLCGYCVGAVWV